jgi:iron complex transport system permease protein
VAVGVALGMAGLLMQSLARNALASPDTLGVTSGAYLAITAVAAFGISVPFWASGIVAFAGGLVAAVIVLGLAGGAGSSTTRLVLAGSALALAFQAATSALLILFSEQTKGLLAWGAEACRSSGSRRSCAPRRSSWSPACWRCCSPGGWTSSRSATIWPHPSG